MKFLTGDDWQVISTKGGYKLLLIKTEETEDGGGNNVWLWYCTNDISLNGRAIYWEDLKLNPGLSKEETAPYYPEEPLSVDESMFEDILIDVNNPDMGTIQKMSFLLNLTSL